MRPAAILVVGVAILCLGSAGGCNKPPKEQRLLTSLGNTSKTEKTEPAKNQDEEVARFPAAPPQEPAAGNKGGDKGKDAEPEAKAQQRKIRYTADLRIICEDLDKASDKMQDAIDANEGIVAHSETVSSPGQPRSAQWRVRIPVKKFTPFRAAVRKLGDIEKDTADSEDLTAEYYDLEADIKNKESEEKSLRTLLENSGQQKMENILAIRRELSEVRGHINRQQGRLKLIGNLTDLTTVTVGLREKQKYDPAKPPELTEAASFGERVGYVFTTSWDALKAFVQFVVLAAIALAPWLVLLAVVAAPVVWLVRRRRVPVVALEVVQENPQPPLT